MFFAGKSDERLDDSGDPLMDGESYVRHLRPDPSVVAAERVPGPGQLEPRAVAIPPTVLSMHVPADHQPGQPVLVLTEHGPFAIPPPEGALQGADLSWPLKPTAEFVVEVPPDSGPGSTLAFTTADGVDICCEVPEGTQPGDTFEVLPPALMVLVPEGAAPGDYVVFPRDVPGRKREWCRAQVPAELKLGAFFAARLPPDPEELSL